MTWLMISRIKVENSIDPFEFLSFSIEEIKGSRGRKRKDEEKKIEKKEW